MKPLVLSVTNADMRYYAADDSLRLITSLLHERHAGYANGRVAWRFDVSDAMLSCYAPRLRGNMREATSFCVFAIVSVSL